MTEKRFIWKCDDETCYIFDTVTTASYFYEGIMNLLNEQQATISALKEENEQLKNELRKEKSLREYSDSMYDADLIVNIRFSNGEWKADVSVIDDE